jgi:methionine synthase / methylenetetrahydrofolate reductase(NADPH)
LKPSGQEFLERLQNEIVVGDGAFGTRLYEMGITFDISYEQFNVTRPDLVEKVLGEYASAGAMVIETNTFCLNRLKQRKFGLEDQIREMGASATRIARQVAGPNRYVAASMGPLARQKRDLEEYSRSEVEEFFREPLSVMVEAGADLIILETFTSLSELETALSVAKKFDVPVVCQMAYGDQGTTASGITVERAVRSLTGKGADVIGANCRSGPHIQIDILKKEAGATNLPLSVFPNAGYAQQVDGRYIYQSSPQYFGEQTPDLVRAGATLIGGCCGTTAEHIRAIAQAAKNLKPKPRARVVVSAVAETEAPDAKEERKGGEKFLRLFRRSGSFVTVEIEPPRNFNLKKALEGARQVAQFGCDALNIPDNALASVRMDNVIFADLVRQHLELPVILHLTCRDKNLIALQSDLLGAQMVGIDAILAVTGDPASIGDQPGASSVYDINSIGLVDMVHALNQGTTQSGVKLDAPTDFAIGVALNPNVTGEKGLDGAFFKLRKKIVAGAQFVETQPMYDPKLLEKLLKVMPSAGIPICVGLMPIMNRKNAEFFHNEVPGLKIPLEIREKFEGLEKDAAEAEGIRQAKEMIDIAWSGNARHFYIVPPLGRFHVAAQLVEYIKSK